MCIGRSVVSASLQPHGQRRICPWDSPGKNSGVGSHSFLYGISPNLGTEAGSPALMVPVVKNLPANSRDIKDTGSIPGPGRTPGGGHSNPLQYSWLENPMDRGAWWATIHRVTKSQTQLKRLSTHAILQCRQILYQLSHQGSPFNILQQFHLSSHSSDVE